MRHKSFSTSPFALNACLVFLWLFHLHLSSAIDTLRAGEVLKDWQVLESQNKFFQFGFFSPSSNRYLAIRCEGAVDYKMVWVANRDNPLSDTSGYLNITRDGYMVIGDEKGALVTINSGESAATDSTTSLTLLDSGNLVLRASQRIVWQSFDHPTDAILPGMKIGLFDLKKNPRQPRKQFLTSWLSPGRPSTGAFTLGVDPNNTKRLEVRQRGVPYWRSGEWNERNRSYFPFLTVNYQKFKFNYTANENEIYFSYTLINANYSWIEINSTGSIRVFDKDSDSSFLDNGARCGIQNGFYPQGCIEQQASKCSDGDEFLLVLGSMGTWDYLDNKSLGLSDCEEKCRYNCSCTAYASFLSDGSGCKFSVERTYDNNPIVEWAESFYVRKTTAQNHNRAEPKEEQNSPAPPVTLPPPKGTARKKKERIIIVGVVVSFGLLGLACSLYCIIWRKCLFKGKRESSQNQVGGDTQKFLSELGTSIAAMDESGSNNFMIKGNMDHELPLFSFSTIETATGHFSEANKLGRGGFGPVFKGKLVDGKEIAVKRLSERSSQGVEEFKNEVMLISKVQHRNLVRIYGCCVKGEEKILIYEYLPNKSLDTFLFDETKRQSLDWKLRINIIEGIAQGLLYLHKYSRLKIIHRDLKTSNILLDNNMNPKISDFGTAKIFGENESCASTGRIVGTYGYMSPEYAMDGLFSVKSDVFSFGVMMLEIISGKRNTGYYQANQSLSLVRHAWNLWKEDMSFELVDPILVETCSTTEFRRCVQISLLCVQENAADRPTMSDVVSMLNSSDTGILPDPRQSTLSTLQRDNSGDQPNGSGSSVNGVTISTTYAR